jgi:hypothetical protein
MFSDHLRDSIAAGQQPDIQEHQPDQSLIQELVLLLRALDFAAADPLPEVDNHLQNQWQREVFWCDARVGKPVDQPPHRREVERLDRVGGAAVSEGGDLPAKSDCRCCEELWEDCDVNVFPEVDK